MPLHLRNKRKTRFQSVYGANKSVIPCLGEIKLPVEIHGLRLSGIFLIFDSAANDMFLGLPFLRKYEATLKFSPKVNILSLLVELPVHAENYIKLAPFEEVVISGTLRHDVPDSTEGHCSPATSTVNKGIFAAHEVVTVFDNRVPVRLYNSCRRPISINKGERICTYRITEPDTEYEPYDSPMVLPQVNSISTQSDQGQRSTTSEHTSPVPDINWSQSEVSEEQLAELKNLIKEFSDCFVDPITKKLGLTDMVECKIDIKPGSTPVQKYPYRIAPAMRETMKGILEGQLKQGLIEEANTGAWASPALLVKKGSGGFRLVIDYRGLNAATIPTVLRIPRIDELLDTIGENQPKFFSVLDCTQGFHQIPLHVDSRDLTGFITPMGKYRYRTMPQGFRSAPAVFQSLMDTLLRGISFKYVMVYIDDICIFSPTFEKHMDHLREVLSRIRRANLKLHPKKCQFAVKKVGYLGHVLTPEGVSPNPDKVEAISSYPVPKKIKHVRAFLGMAGYYRKFVQNYSELARPLYDLTKKDASFIWTDDCQQSFQKLKDALVGDRVLAFPDFTKTFHLDTDASKTGIGACLSQYDDEGQLRPVGFAGRGFTKAESNYSVTQQECLAIVWAVQHFRVYLEGTKFELRTDHSALTWMLREGNPSGRIARWITFLQQFEYSIKHVKGKHNVVPDSLSRRPYDVTETKADEVIEQYPYLGAISASTPPKSSDATNKLTFIYPLMPSDKQLRFVDEPEIIPPNPRNEFPQDHDKLGDLIDSGQSPVYLSALTKTPSKIKIRRERLRPNLEKSATLLKEEIDFSSINIKREQYSDPQCKLLIGFLKYNTLPKNEGDARSTILRQEDYIIINDLLYHIYVPLGNKPSTHAQLVIPQNLKGHFLKLHHDSFFGGHVGVAKMTSIMKLKYYWIGMSRDIRHYVLSCLTCQEAKPTTGNLIPPLTLRQPSPGPFHTVFIDTVGPLPKSQGYEHMVCVTDQYSRYIIAWPTVSIKAGTLAQRFYEKIICVYGTPKVLLSDNGTSLVSTLFEELCSMFGIKHTLSAAYHPQSQGQVERAQKSIVTLMRAFVNEKQTNWSQMLPSILWALNTTENQALGTSAFLLLFGRVPHSPADMSLPEIKDVPNTVKDHYQALLSQIDSASNYAEINLEKHQAKVKEYFDKNKSTFIPIEKGDIVFVYQPTIRIQKTKRKLQRKFHGPYIVMDFTSNTSVKLRRGSDGRLLKKPVSIMRLKRGYHREEWNTWDAMDVPSDEEGLDVADIPDDSNDLLSEGDITSSDDDDVGGDPGVTDPPTTKTRKKVQTRARTTKKRAVNYPDGLLLDEQAKIPSPRRSARLIKKQT